jgi:hypothetical protein
MESLGKISAMSSGTYCVGSDRNRKDHGYVAVILMRLLAKMNTLGYELDLRHRWSYSGTASMIVVWLTLALLGLNSHGIIDNLLMTM